MNSFIKQMEVRDNRATGLEVRTREVENRQHSYSGAGAILGAILDRHPLLRANARAAA